MTDDCTSTRPQVGEDARRWACLFNDIAYAETDYIRFTDRMALADHLWEQGWRRDVRPEDITEKREEPK